MGIKHEVAGLCEGLDGDGCENWGKPSGVFVESMGVSPRTGVVSRAASTSDA
jgi:hypothetical protein